MSTVTDANLWVEDATAEAFLDQKQARPYQEMLAETIDWCPTEAGQRWLDLGCGGGQLAKGLYEKSEGMVRQIVAVDCASANAKQIARLREKLQPKPTAEQLTFDTVDFSTGLPQFASESFDGIVSGLAISYAESVDPLTGKYTDAAYRALYREMFRVLKPGGTLVFTVNVPRPNFWKIVWASLPTIWRIRRPLKVLSNTLAMQRVGHWLKEEAERGRFHYWTAPQISDLLKSVGFASHEHRLCYADQAYLFRAKKA